jgi:hypothetical protein
MIRAVGRCFGGSSASVSVSPAPTQPGAVDIDLGLSRGRMEGILEDDIPSVRERVLDEEEDFRSGE